MTNSIVNSQRSPCLGNNIDDDKVPSIITFSKMLFSAILALDVIFIFSCWIEGKPRHTGNKRAMREA